MNSLTNTNSASTVPAPQNIMANAVPAEGLFYQKRDMTPQEAKEKMSKLSDSDKKKVLEIMQEVATGKMSQDDGEKKIEAILNGSAASISFSFILIASLALGSFLISA